MAEPDKSVTHVFVWQQEPSMRCVLELRREGWAWVSQASRVAKTWDHWMVDYPEPAYLVIEAEQEKR